MANEPKRLLIAASGTGGHLFPAIALAEKLPDYEIEWLGVPNRLETQLVPAQYPLNTIEVEGFQQGFGLGTLGILLRLTGSIRQVRQLLKDKNFQGVFSTGGYIAAPAIIAARSIGIPVIMHESNALPGKVTRWLSPWCNSVALGFEYGAHYLPRAGTAYTGTPVRAQFRTPQKLELPIPEDVPLIAVVGGSQGAVAVNQIVRECAPAWLKAGAWIVHLTGDNDPDAQSFQHPQYFSMPFYDNMAALLQRTNLAISRAGAGTLTELAVTQTPAILIPYPFAAEDHQVYNGAIFNSAGAGLVFRQSELTPQLLESKVLNLLQSPEQLQQMAQKAATLAVPDSAERLADLVRRTL
ncbi:undecaprenyldiphospho-muramoylpentapeptide beta-N-acetylglucosaminyltransferase [Coleofasciculus sp. FACHB-T130]|uniref:undecaprenyldiphospho-muramoylpentapeptide beta-N-acetylglucosaminyltransferase n=1 Tax=Cyanophyceae TaxID=3028117 RepID=UPI001686DB2B|nr:undecaprenyldiphospho-muramoylpentapeptide beta-N-acetylglucosaminyltransferase [Coleofasciculus sp. FACHB-T130]MBD1881732.1 undecaprenyldiphospho-muramoylpentapeptide beta-N-acetylglucosaminyltransferase [Coleofasciculus sp. FACHB-T130]